MSKSNPAEQQASAAGGAAAASGASASQDEVNHANLILIALTAGLGLALLTVGLWNALLVVAFSMLLVCNPWVRTLLELPSVDGKRGLSTFDPARYLLSSKSSSAEQVSTDDELLAEATDDDSIMQTDQLYTLAVMPDALRDSSQTLIRFVVRDFVQGWYDSLTFAHPNFPISAEANISHTAASIYLRARQLKSANTAAELLLTVQSVLLSSLRRRRASSQYATGAASSARSTWPSTAARVDALRKAVRKLLSRNLAHAERSSPVLMLLLTEIVAKQAWQVVQTIGDPDFINQKIVEWAEPASETSLEAQAISPEELERLKSLDTAALETQAAEALRSSVAENQPTAAADRGDASAATAASSHLLAQSTLSSSPAAAAHAPASQPPRPQAPQTLAENGRPATQTSNVDPRIAYDPASRSAGSSQPPRPRITPPRKANSTGPLSALGGFATGALGALADAAERAVDVVGGTVDEFGNLLMVPADPSTRNRPGGGGSPSNSTDASPRRRYMLLAERDENESSPVRGRPADSGAPAYHLDMPSGVDEPPLPDSLRQSMRPSNDNTLAFSIPDTPERTSMDAHSIVAPAPVAAALNLSSRDSFSIDEVEEDEQASLAAMHDLLSDRTSPAYEAFENFLEHPDNRFCGQNEGESLLRLHTQLNTLASIMEFATLDEQTFRADASTILTKALEQLPSALPATHDGQRAVLVRRSAQQVLTNLEWCANMDVVEPLRENIIARLVQLYKAYLVGSGQRTQAQQQAQQQSAQSSPSTTRFAAALPRTESPEPNQLRAFLDRENRPSFSSQDSERPAIRYEPRRKTTAPTGVTAVQPGVQTPPRAPSVPPAQAQAGAPVMGPPLGPSRPMSVPPRVPSAPPKAQQMVVPSTTPTAAASPVSSQNPTRTSTDSTSTTSIISITDISANAESTKPVDVRTFEVMISVEGVADPSDTASVTSPDGFVLVRRWHEFEQMDAEIQRQPRSSNRLPRLPAVKGRRSADVCRLLEAYLWELLLPANRGQLAGVGGAKRFFDRTRAGASAEDLRRKGRPGAFLGGIGKGIVSGVGMVGKQAVRTGATGVQALSSATGVRNGADGAAEGMSPLRSGSVTEASTLRSGSTPDGAATRVVPTSPVVDSASSTTSAFVSRTNSPSPSPSRRPAAASTTTAMHPNTTTATRRTSELSARHLDMLLSSIFAVADEAFNLQGGWTLRRGMLRVLEQVVRTTYATSIVAGFNNTAASLNVDNFAKWIADLTRTMWPDGRRWGSEIGTPDEKRARTAAEMQRTAERAREIVVSYAPAQAGYVLGPGGKVACVKALAEVHATLMDPITAGDLGLTVVLKALDMASR
ncbi:conserved hypothetical protein [Sporisorium reilianum SRZ2]|uniref:PXA domain-containing protein n=1 Tax=Sporisorium reilianum (strain SRZ2) TaxID=999809 RepID=E6ZWR4_SPORE|nr:conserved hypothetical protein [Sporisorium reilianum SRZ2]